jgi:hypothetical protein
MQQVKQKQFAFSIYYSGLLLLIAFLPLSKFVMSVSQFMIIGGWLIDGQLVDKFKRFFTSRLALLLVSVYMLHIAGLFYTTDFEYAIKDLRIKLPLLILPLLLSTGPKVSVRQFEYLLYALISGVTISTLISFFIYLGIIVRPVNDIRDISIFISHIRLSLLCCLSVFAAAYLAVNRYRAGNYLYVFILLALSAWLIYFLFLIESLTGILIMMAGMMILPAWLFYRYGNMAVKIATLAVCILIPLLATNYIMRVDESFNKSSQKNQAILAIKTASGNPYVHSIDNFETENGNRVWNYVCEEELQKEWNKRSKINYHGRDLKNQEIKYTLIRFLSSRDLTKDSVGVWKLTPAEIVSIEKGIANVDYQQKSSIRARVHQVIWEFKNAKIGHDPSGHSVIQRLEFWKAALGIIKQNLLTGVGTGDVPDAFKQQYVKTGSPLSEQWRLRSHNQYLSFAVAFGLTGAVWFIITLFYPLYKRSAKRDFLYVAFSLIAIISMLTEDTLETQAGVTFFALFNSLLLFVNPQNARSGVNSNPEE